MTIPPPTRSGHRLRTTLIVVIVLIGLLVAIDFVARAVAQNRLASDIQSHGFPRRPSVSIEGFPFLTQLVGRDLHDVQISSSDVPAGPLAIKRINAGLYGVHLNSSYNGGTVDRLTGKAMITFSELSDAIASQAGVAGVLGSARLKLSDAGHNEVKASLNVLVGSATWKISGTAQGNIRAVLVHSSGLTSSLLSSVRDITIPLPALPMGLRIQRVSVTPGGIVGSLTSHNVSFGS